MKKKRLCFMKMMMMLLIMLMDEVQEVIGPPAVSVTTADVFATIQAKVICLSSCSVDNDHYYHE